MEDIDERPYRVDRMLVQMLQSHNFKEIEAELDTEGGTLTFLEVAVLWVHQLEILSSLRNLQPLLTKTIDAMPLVYDINKDVRFNQGIEKGIEKGELIKSQKSVIHLLKKEKFSFETIADFAEVDLDFVKKTQQSYLLVLDMLKNNCSDEEIVRNTGLSIEVVQKIK